MGPGSTKSDMLRRGFVPLRPTVFEDRISTLGRLALKHIMGVKKRKKANAYSITNGNKHSKVYANLSNCPVRVTAPWSVV